MQRRAAGHPSSSSSSPHQQRPTSSNKAATARLSRRQKGSSSVFKKFQPFLLLLSFFAVASLVSWSLFPSQVLEVEHEAEEVGHRLAEKAINAEHEVEDWWNRNHGGSGGSANSAGGGSGGQNYQRRTSEEATARMLAQSSKWVDGEKALKKKLSILEEEQKNNKNLGVPILTRWLGDDFPAWVTPDMDEKEWRSKVDEKYAEMRKEEEEWIKQMQKIVDANEHNLNNVDVSTTR